MSFEEIIGRYCCAKGCAARRESEYVMCRQHWWLVPVGIQRRTIRAMGRFSRSHTSGNKTTLRMALASARRAVEEQEAKLAQACVAAHAAGRKRR